MSGNSGPPLTPAGFGAVAKPEVGGSLSRACRSMGGEAEGRGVAGWLSWSPAALAMAPAAPTVPAPLPASTRGVSLGAVALATAGRSAVLRCAAGTVGTGAGSGLGSSTPGIGAGSFVLVSGSSDADATGTDVAATGRGAGTPRSVMTGSDSSATGSIRSGVSKRSWIESMPSPISSSKPSGWSDASSGSWSDASSGSWSPSANAMGGEVVAGT